MARSSIDRFKIKGISISSLEKELGFSNALISKWSKADPMVSNLKKNS